MINEQSFLGDSTAELSTPLPDREGPGESLFNSIDSAIRTERLYANMGLQRQDICDRFDISRHALNDLLTTYANGQSLPQYINNIRLEEALRLLRDASSKTLSTIATDVGFTPANLREQFKRKYGITPAEYRRICEEKNAWQLTKYSKRFQYLQKLHLSMHAFGPRTKCVHMFFSESNPFYLILQTNS